MSDQQQTLSIPSLLFLAALSAIAVKYFFFTPSGSPSSSRGNPRIANPADIEQISQMFPQIPRRDIIWDLQRNGGSVAATTERILSRGTLETVSIFSVLCFGRGARWKLLCGEPAPSRNYANVTDAMQPPPTFQPALPPTPRTPSTARPSPSQSTPEHIDLIKRYNLSTKVSNPSPAHEGETAEIAAAQGGWSNNKNERQALLRWRREEMVLQARRKLEEKERERARGVDGS